MPLESSLFYGSSSPSPGRSSGSSRRPSQATPSASTSSSTASTSKTTPSPFHTSRIPAPSSATTTTTTTTSSSSPSSNRARRRPAATPSTSKVSPANFKLHFAGRVYRPFAHTSPPHARKSSAASASSSPHSRPLLGQPDELVNYAQAIVDCVCKRNVDDSTLMVQCEDCDVWVHARCVGFESEDDCPEQYHCRKCAPAAYKRLRQSTPTPGEQSKAREASSSRSARPSTPPPSSLRSAGISKGKVKNALQSRVTPPASDADSDDDDEGGLEVEQPSMLSNPAGSSPLSRTPPRTQLAIRHHHASASPSRHSVSRNLLSELANASPIIKASQSHPLLTPTKRKARTTHEELGSDANSSRLGQTPKAPHSRAVNPTLDPATVPLPDHYTSLLSLHSAVERALLLHLATEGSKACSATIASASDGTTSQSPSGASDGTLAIDMPNLATYTGVRAVVERGANKRFGPTELAQLIWLWEGGLHGPRATEDGAPTSAARPAGAIHDERRGGLSLTVSAARELDRAKGKKVYTWGIGIRLELKQNVQLPALEVVDDVPAAVAAAAAAASPSSTSSSPTTNKLKRYGLSMLPLWSSKAEWRREEVRRRLGECVLRAHDNFVGPEVDSSKATPSKRQKLPASGGREKSSAYTLPTPPPSHRKQHSHGRSGSSITASTTTACFAKGFILDALPPIPAATLPPLGPASTASLSAPPLSQAQEKEKIANADMADVAAAERLAMQVTTKDLGAYTAEAETNKGKRDQLLSGQKDSVVRAAPEQRAMSLLERIKAKEAAQAQAAQTTSQSSTKSIGNSRQPSTARSAALSSLEAASARAKRREISTDARSRSLL